MSPATETARELLDAAYSGLDLIEGDLIETTEGPTPATESAWVEKGEWLALGRQVRAERIFFVDNNPVVVFAEYGDSAPDEWVHYFNHVWCMARPQLLFLARDGELSVFNLTKTPAHGADDQSREERLLATIAASGQVQQELQRYRRDQIESGRLFEDARFGYENRADRALIRDLKIVRRALVDTNLAVTHAHALIGRAIFIRYLEDRKVLIPDYFQSVAEKHGRDDWRMLLTKIQPDAILKEEERPIFPRVLLDKDFTYALFEQLANDLNGDIFPISKAERDAVTSDQLELLRRFLLGQADRGLFFFAYRFDIIPIELISSMYEEFYAVERGKREKQGSFYTPASLVEFVLSHTLKDEVLDRMPRIMDPACGSGIFLVEAFRRLVRHRMKKLGRRLEPAELKAIVRDQIAGIDINPEAVRVAAFSLYLALLHYHEPRDILQHKLPNLTYDRDREQTDPGQHFDVLVASDAFQIGATVARDDVQDQFGTACADIVVGNPPWGDPQSPDLLVTAGKRGAMAWCRKNQRAVGDRELSQAFIHRTLDLLRDGGRAGLLVSTGVFFKGHKNSQQFRRQWLSAISLQHVVNFAAVRDTFFRGPSHRHRPRRGAAGILQDAVFTESARNEGSIAPFASVIFEKTPAPNNQRFAYWSAKKTSFIERVQVVVLSRADVHVVRQDRMIADDELWKVYWWGSHRDEALIEALRINPTLRQIVGPDAPGAPRFGRGYEKTKKGKVPSDWLAEYKELPSSKLTRYGPITPSMLVPVSGTVYRRGNRTVYDGTRLIIRRGISQRGTSKGRIIARLATEPFCFLNSVHGVRLYDHAEGDAEVLLGIVWSSLIRYFAFMTCGSWGPWHHEIHLEDLERLPIRIPSDPRLRQRISETVSALRAINAEEFGLLHPEKHSQEAIEDRIRGLEAELDAAIFDLFELDDAERDLVYDLCTAGLDLFYRGMESAAFNAVLTEPAHLVGRKNDIDHTFRRWKILRDYIHAFLDVLERNLPKDSAEFYFRAVRPDDVSPMLAMIFSVENADEPPAESITSLEDAWAFAVALVASASLQPFHAQRIYIDGMTRIVTETDIAIIKRNELRLWTRSAAREDAEATLHQILRRQHATKIGEVRSAHA